MILARAADDVSTLAFAFAGFVLGHVLFTWVLGRAAPRAGDTDPAATRFALELGFVFLVGLFASRALAGLVLTRMTTDPTVPPALEATLAVSLAANAAIVVAAILVARARGRGAADVLGWPETTVVASARAMSFGIVGLLAMIPAFLGAGALNARLLELAGVEPLQQSVRQLIADRDLLASAEIVAGIGVVGPFLEEVLFRGLLLRALLAALPAGRAIVVSALVFALVHDVPSMLPVFVLGLAFGALYFRTRSIAAPFSAHLLFNLTQLCYVIPTA